MSQLTQSNTESLGNTKPDSRSRSYIMTWNNYDEKDYIEIKSYFDTMTHWIIGKEIAPTTGTKHLQGYFYNKNAIRFSTLKTLYPKASWRVAKGTKEQNFIYCSKENYESNYKPKIETPLKIITELREWQKNIENILLTEPDDRTIYWIIDHEGNKGKTALCKYLVHNYKAAYVSGKANDIKHIIAELKEKPNIVLFDYPRSLESYVSYQAIEEIKNGIFCSGKYESKTIVMNSPHIIVFSNFIPDLTKLSKDRWNIINI